MNMQLLEKVTSNILLCGVELAFGGKATPSDIAGWQPFYNSTLDNASFEKTYAGLVSINYDEESSNSTPGVSWKQKVTFKFPNSDKDRANRSALMHKIKFVKLRQTNGLDLIIGRNDYNQNTDPTIKVKSDENITEVSIECVSIFPTGYSPSVNTYGLPALIPITLS